MLFNLFLVIVHLFAMFWYFFSSFLFWTRREKREKIYEGMVDAILQSININFPGFFFLNRSYFPSRHALKTFSWLKKLVARARGGGGGGGDKWNATLSQSNCRFFSPPRFWTNYHCTAPRLWYIFNGEYPPVGYFHTRLFFPRIGAKRGLMKTPATWEAPERNTAAYVYNQGKRDR